MEIIWSSVAKANLYELLQDVEIKFGRNVAKKVSLRLRSYISLLSSFPRIGVRYSNLSQNEIEVRYLVNTPNLVFYAVDDDRIYIVSILDCRRSPERIREIVDTLLLYSSK